MTKIIIEFNLTWTKISTIKILDLVGCKIYVRPLNSVKMNIAKLQQKQDKNIDLISDRI